MVITELGLQREQIFNVFFTIALIQHLFVALNVHEKFITPKNLIPVLNCVRIRFVSNMIVIKTRLR